MPITSDRYGGIIIAGRVQKERPVYRSCSGRGVALDARGRKKARTTPHSPPEEADR